METSWHSYPSIFALGHRALAELLLDPVLVEEKIDGSQFSFGRFDGELKCRSKGAVLNVLAPEKMFAKGVEIAGSLTLVDGWTYRSEYLCKPKHNTLAYDRAPDNNIIIFDINSGHEEYLGYEEKRSEAKRLGLECVPLLRFGMVENLEDFRSLLDTVSCLGGQKIEGIVVKNYRRFGPDKKVLMGKFVSEAFKEIHGAEWKATNPSSGDIQQRLIVKYRTAARWAKAIQHLREQGLIEDSPRDIGKLIPEVRDDIVKECSEAIKEELFDWAIGHVLRGCVAGAAEWYKEELLKRQFEKPE